MITLILIFLSGCIETKVYLGREDQGDENDQVYGAVNPTTIPAGITWGTFRAYINENFEEVDLAIDTLDNGLADAVDSITAHRTAIQLRLLKSDSTIFASQHDLATGLAGKQDTFTLKTVNGESLVGSGDITIEGGGGAWGSITGTLADQEDLSDALGSKQDTSFRLSAIAALADGSGQLTNDGSGNYSWVATGGTGTVTSVGLSAPIGFTVTNSPITTNGNISLAFTTGYSLPMTADQVNWSSAYDWVNLNGANAVTAYGWGNHATAGYVPSSRTVNSKALSSNISLTASDVGAQPVATILSTLAGLSDGSGVLTNNGSGVLSWTAAGGGGTVTSVGLSAPTGLTVSNSPITTNGTISLSFTTGYSIPTTANQTNWTTAYNWGNHASAGYLTAADTLSLDARIQVLEDDYVDSTLLNTIVPMLHDTIPLFVFGAGGGNVNDTACFSTSTIYGAFYNAGSDTLVVTSLRSVLSGSSPSLTIDVMWHATRGSASATHLNTTPPTITSTTTGDNDTSFNNSVIPPGVWVWATSPTVTTKPLWGVFELIGYKQNRSY